MSITIYRKNAPRNSGSTNKKISNHFPKSFFKKCINAQIEEVIAEPIPAVCAALPVLSELSSIDACEALSATVSVVAFVFALGAIAVPEDSLEVLVEVDTLVLVVVLLCVEPLGVLVEVVALVLVEALLCAELLGVLAEVGTLVLVDELIDVELLGLLVSVGVIILVEELLEVVFPLLKETLGSSAATSCFDEIEVFGATSGFFVGGLLMLSAPTVPIAAATPELVVADTLCPTEQLAPSIYG